MTKFVSLFRAINVGGNSQVKMDTLKAMHEAIGLSNVVTYLQTGNVVFECSKACDPEQLAGQIGAEFEKSFGFSTQVMVRSSAEMQTLSDKNPFPDQPDKETKWIVVMFLTACPESAAQQALFESYKGPEELFIAGQELYIYYPNGIGRSKLSNTLIEKKLKVYGTGRNWNTVTKLLEMTRP
ncbi:MAG TPA: DUF1697 domain-containing protein [Chloroflexia bacterium]|nr:DUF1697 domain-containing protein [Chloroflexia bacterium]